MGHVSVLIPTHERAAYLREAMASVLGQTHKDLALIVCDNASTDATADVVASFGGSDARVRHVLRAQNVGMVENHRSALAEDVDPRSEHVLMISDDDLLDPTMVADTTAVLDANPAVGMVHGAFRLIDAAGNVLVPFAEWTHDLAGDTIERGLDFVRKGMRWPSRVCASTAMMRAVAKPPVEAEDYPPIDQGMWLRLALDWDVAYLHRPLASYRIHAATHSASFGTVDGAGYRFSPQLVRDVYRVKERFLDEHGHRLPDAAAMRRLAEKGRSQALVLRARQLTLPQRSFVETARTLAESVAIDPRVAIEPAAWLLLAGSVVGPRAVMRLRRRTA